MGKIDEFQNSGRTCRRWELDGLPPVTVLVRRTTIRYRGADHPMVVTIWKGLHMLDTGRETWLVAQSTTSDAGPKLGVALSYDVPPAIPVSKEERLANRIRLDLVLRQIRPGLRLADLAGTIDDPA